MAQDPKKDAAPAKSNKKMIMIVAAVLVLAGGGGAAWFFMQPKAEPDAHKTVKHHEKAEAPVYMTLETFTVNLQPDPGEQYLQAEMSLQIADAHEEENIKTHMPLVRNRVLMVLSSKKSSEISTLEGKTALTKELVSEINKPFAEGGEAQTVSDVLFTSFIIQ
ncbi:MAG: flagellar basal body-associated protein FliL [Methylophilaceae bacterium]|nr:flagellar basal body-associated protein FliL [Methylophilaceae bacterium]